MFVRFAAALIALGLTCFQACGLTSLTNNVNIYVDGANGNDSNSGLSYTSAWKTFAPVYNYLCYQTFGNGFGAFIQVANASSISGAGGIGGMFYLNCTPLGYAYVVLNLGGGTLIPSPGYDAVAVATAMQGNDYASPVLHVTNGTLTCSGGGSGVHVVSGFVVVGNFIGTLSFGSCFDGFHVYADGAGARIFINSGYTISGGAASHLFALAGGGIDFNGANGSSTLTCSGSPTFITFAQAQLGPGWIYVPHDTISFSGCTGVTGTRYVASDNGTIYTDGAGANFFPGDSPGAMIRGGHYDSPGTPWVSSCGSGPGTPNGTDMAGNIVEGSLATGCTINFTTTNEPRACTASISNSNAQAGLVVSSLTSASLTVSHPAASGATLYWLCPTR
jgi:hypothetical protein